MTILLFGVSNVGKSVTGALLATKLNYDFYDIDEEIKKSLRISLEEFVSTGTLYQRDQIRCKLLSRLLHQKGNKVIAVTPLSYMENYKQPFFHSKEVLAIELLDTVENIFGRLVFSDENDMVYKDDFYKSKHKQYYLSEITSDLKWYGSVYADIDHKFNMAGKSPDNVVDSLLLEFQFDKES